MSLNRISFSGKRAGEKLKVIAGKGVVLHCVTRFSTYFLLFDRLVVLKSFLPQILTEFKIDNLTVEQWDLLEDCRRLLKPFADFTDILAKETEATISLVVPSVDALSGFLQVIAIYLIHVYYKF